MQAVETRSEPLYKPAVMSAAKDLEHLPGSWGLPLLGITPNLVLKFDQTVLGAYQRYGEISKANIFFQPGVLVGGPENVRKISLNAQREFSNWIGYSNVVAEWFGKALLLRDYEDHSLQRRVVLATFNPEAMRSYAVQSDRIVDAELGGWGRQRRFVALPNLRQLLMRIAAKVFYGLDEISVGAQQLSEAFGAMLGGMESVVRLDTWPLSYHRGLQGKAFVRRYLSGLVPERGKGGNDLMSNMVRAMRDDQQAGLTEEELIDHLSFLFFASYDTTTTTLLHLLMHLGMDTKLQEQLREESRALNKSSLDYEDFDRMEGIGNAFRETLRLYPAITFTLRGTTRTTELGGYSVPANTLLFIPSIINHTLPHLWRDPLKFDPARFGKGREEHKQGQGFHYHPFGGGAHKCVGARFAEMNTKIFLHKLLLRYRFETPRGYKPRIVKLPMPKPTDGVPLTFRPL